MHRLQAMLETKTACLLDCSTELFIWIGRHSPIEARSQAIEMAEDLIRILDRPKWTPITRVVENGETCLFRDKFKVLTIHHGQVQMALNSLYRDG